MDRAMAERCSLQTRGSSGNSRAVTGSPATSIETERRAASLQSRNPREPLRAAAVEYDESVAARKTQHVTYVVGLALVERQAGAGELALDVEAREAVMRTCH
jgi:hypothetical protein